MKRFTLWLISAVAVGTLASCAGSKDDSAPLAEAPTTAEKTATSSAKRPAPGFGALQAVIMQTKSAIEKGDFKQAKSEFGKFEESWKTVEDGVKAKTPKVYSAIEDGMDSVSEGIKGKNKEKTLTALNALKVSVSSAAQ